MRYGSLFSGTGALDMGIQSVLGGETVWHSEIEHAPSKIHAHHWPDVPNLGDVTKVDWSAVEPVDVITGGSPCQDVSAAFPPLEPPTAPRVDPTSADRPAT